MIIRKFLKYVFFLIRNIIKRERFLRLSLWEKGKLIFFDVKRFSFLSFRSRGYVDSFTADQIFTHHEYDLKPLAQYDEILKFYNGLIEKGKKPLIVDCGANIGLSACFFAQEFSEAEIIAIEPNRENFLAASIHTQNLDNVKLLNAAVGSHDGYVGIIDNEADSNAFQVSEGSENAKIKMLGLNKLLETTDAIPFLIKIDIEGFEKDLFSEHTEWFDQFKVAIVEIHDWDIPGKALGQSFFSCIGRYRRDFVQIGENSYSIRNDEK